MREFVLLGFGQMIKTVTHSDMILSADFTAAQSEVRPVGIADRPRKSR
jgi:hypothetical protein